jgi:hypothetical protein
VVLLILLMWCSSYCSCDAAHTAPVVQLILLMWFRFFGQQVDPVAAKTAANYGYNVRGILGWLHNVRGVPLEELSFRRAFPSAERAGVVVAFDYLQWLATERGANARTQQITLHGLMHAAKFTYHEESKVGAACSARCCLRCASLCCYRLVPVGRGACML